MKDFPCPPLTKQDRQEILVEALMACREKDVTDLFLEVEQKIKERGHKPDFETIQLILDDQ